MRSSFEIVASTGSYSVEVEPGLVDRLTGERRDDVWIVDDYLAARIRGAGIDPIVIVADEGAKSLDRMGELIAALRERGATRATTLIAVGGGVVQDAAAFAASVYMRGIDWIYVPTTLLSVVDSCIGGKSSINVGRFKNLVGTFHPPVLVAIDTALSATLSDEQRAAGLCEAAKICLCRDAATFDAYLTLGPSPAADADTLAAITALSLGTKKWFIEIDEFDRGERLLLNFGHTFGHALEAACDFAVSHGIAVGLGMLAAFHLGEAMGIDYGKIPHCRRFRDHIVELVSARSGLADALAPVRVAAMMDAFRSDKKHRQDAFAVILVGAAGAVERRMLPRDEATTRLIEHAFAAMLADWTKSPHDVIARSNAA